MAVVRDPVSADLRTDSTAKKVPETAALKPGGGEGGKSRERDRLSFAGYLVSAKKKGGGVEVYPSTARDGLFFLRSQLQLKLQGIQTLSLKSRCLSSPQAPPSSLQSTQSN